MNILLIPSAALLPAEMQASIGKIPSVLYPHNNAAILDHIIEKYQRYVDKIYVITYHASEMIEDYIRLRHLNIEIIKLDSFQDIGYSIYYSLRKILKNEHTISQLFINFGDTLTQNPVDNTQNIIYYDIIPLDGTWTYFEESGGRFTKIRDKEETDDSYELGKVFVGEFSIQNPNHLYQILSDYQSQQKKSSDSYYVALSEYAHNSPFTFQKAINWIDVGHSNTSLKAKIEVAAREFNSITVDANRGILKKTSKETKKFINEIFWYLSLPKELAYCTPRIYDYSTDTSKPFISMEYYGYSTLHELLIYSKLSIGIWQNIFERLEFILSDMMQKSKGHSVPENFSACLYQMYCQKTIDRLNSLRSVAEFSPFFKQNITINGNEYPSLSYLLEKLPDVVIHNLIHNHGAIYSIIHGDLCFTNIIVEPNYHFIRLIDPRGSFGVDGIFGDLRYDFAKLLHSLEGGYDYIIEDLAQVSVNETRILCSTPPANQSITHIFHKVFGNYLKELPSIRLIESTLFLSMIPLHSDVPSRQYAMLATGVKLFWEALAKINGETSR